MNWEDIFESIYFREFKRENYLPRRSAELKQELTDLGWQPNEIVARLTEAHNHGYTGFHFIKGAYPTEVVDKLVSEMFSGTAYLSSKYCKTHDSMCLYINPFVFTPRTYLWSFEQNGDKYVDFCYEPNNGELCMEARTLAKVEDGED